MNRTESVFTQDGLSSTVDTSDKLKLGEFFYLRRNNRYSLICVHCFQEFDQERFAEFTVHIEQHLLRIWGIQVKPMKMENPTGTGAALPLPPHAGAYAAAAAANDLSLFKNEFGGPTNAGELPQYFYNGYNPANGWFQSDNNQQSSSAAANQADMNCRKNTNNSQQYEDEFNALKRSFNEPMFVINDTPEVRQLSQYLAESYPIEKRAGQYKCPLCEKLFNGSALARRHVYTHSVDKVFACGTCQRKFSHARHLRDHIRTKHGNPANLPERPTNRGSSSSSNNRSSYDISNVSHSLGNHFMNVSGGGHSMVLTGEAGSTSFQQEFDALQALYKDNKSIIVNDLPEIREISQYLMPNYEFSKINDQVMCPLCDGTFNSKSTVRRHLTNHLRIKMFRCGQCEREFRHARHCQEHIKSKHHSNFYDGSSSSTEHKAGGRNKPVAIKSEPYETNKKIECYICHTKFKRRSNLKTAAGSYAGDLNCCNACNKNLARRPTMMNMRIPIVDDKNAVRHLARPDEPKHKCDVCHESFNRADKLLNHRRTHKEPMKFYCKFCNLGFMDQKTYATHEMQHAKPSYAHDDRRKPEIPNPIHMSMVGMPIQ